MVYKLHFWPPFKHAAHYSGKSDRLPERLADHAMGRGARLTKVQIEAGGSWVVGRIEPGGSKRERQLKGHDASRHCDVCQALKGYNSGQLSSPEALARAGWARATPYQRELLLDMFGIKQAPERIPEQVPDVRPIRPRREPRVLNEINPELVTLVEALEEGWRRKAPKKPAREIEQLPAVPAPRPAPDRQVQTEITPEPSAQLEDLSAEAKPELELEI